MSPGVLDDVNILAGTASSFDLSHGNTLPIVARPFGMAHWSMQTRADTNFFFHADDPKDPNFACYYAMEFNRPILNGGALFMDACIAASFFRAYSMKPMQRTI